MTKLAGPILMVLLGVAVGFVNGMAYGAHHQTAHACTVASSSTLTVPVLSTTSTIPPGIPGTCPQGAFCTVSPNTMSRCEPFIASDGSRQGYVCHPVSEPSQ